MSLTIDGLEELKARLLHIAENADKVILEMRAEAKDSRLEMQSIVQKRSGFTRDNIVDEELPDGARVWSKSRISQILEYGSAPHIILPRNAKMLHWVENGEHIFAYKVKHPGTRPYPFFRPVVDASKIRFRIRIAEVMKSVN